MFTTSNNKGFSMIFENGFEISVQWGTMNYCSKKGVGDWDESMKDTRWSASSAEIAIFNTNESIKNILNNGEMIAFKDDTVKGWVRADFVAEIMFKISTANSFDELQQQITNEGW
jgi:hypothetical protein